MPVYEFYCPDCHTIYNFFSRRVDTTTRPKCPGCGQPELQRQASLFAISKGRGESEENAELPPGMDEEEMMRAFESMAGDFENLDENDPKQAAGMIRRLFDASGMKLGDGMAEAIRRMEAGEDPDQIEADMGDVLEQENPFAATATKSSLPDLKALRRELLPPERDETWYPLQRSPKEGNDLTIRAQRRVNASNRVTVRLKRADGKTVHILKATYAESPFGKGGSADDAFCDPLPPKGCPGEGVE